MAKKAPKAKEAPKAVKKAPKATKETPKAKKETLKAVKKAPKAVKAKNEPKKVAKETKNKKPFILFRPFVALGHYLRDSWRELRQVRWPNRKATWKMVLAVIIYTAIFATVLLLLDLLFSFIFNKILG